MNEAFKALADPTRRQVLAMLRQAGEMSAGDLAQHFDMTKPTLSHHFNVLREAGLVKSRREGQQIFYSLNTTVLEDVVALFLDLVKRQPDETTNTPRDQGQERKP